MFIACKFQTYNTNGINPSQVRWKTFTVGNLC